jgi:hypothetical protein
VKFEEALGLYERIPEPYSIGFTHLRRSLLTQGDARAHHLAEARRLWLSIDREDFVLEWLDGV